MTRRPRLISYTSEGARPVRVAMARCDVPTRRRSVNTVARSRAASARRMSACCHSSASSTGRSTPVSTFMPGTARARLAGLVADPLAKLVGSTTVAQSTPAATVGAWTTEGAPRTRLAYRSAGSVARAFPRHLPASSVAHPPPTSRSWSTPLGSAPGRRRFGAERTSDGSVSGHVRSALRGGRRPPPHAADPFIAGTLDDVTATRSSDVVRSGTYGDGRTGGPPAGHRLNPPGAAAAPPLPLARAAPGDAAFRHSSSLVSFVELRRSGGHQSTPSIVSFA